MSWFKSHFSAQILANTRLLPFDVNMMTALATQETFEVWGNLFETQTPAKILELCVGDTIDSPARKAFPQNKAMLLSDHNGLKIFQIARAALEAVGEYNAAYHKVAAANPNKFCHGFGIFQYDLQFAKQGNDPDFFLEKKWYNFPNCIDKALLELHRAQDRAGLKAKTSLSELEQAHVAIAYNTGSYNPSKGLKHGFKDSSGLYYGELIYQYILLSKSV